MGYWSIVIEGTGAHHNPDYEFDANRMANELVLQLKAHGADIRRASFLFDYKGDDAGDTLPYLTLPGRVPGSNSDVVFAGEPYSVVKLFNAGGTDHYRLAYKGTIEKRGFWHTDPRFVQGLAERNNEAAAKLKPISGASRDDIEEVVLDGVKVRRLTQEDGCVTTYWDRPAEGIVYRAHSEGGDDRKPFDWEDTYDLDLGGDVYLSWVYGSGDPEGSKPIGAHIHYREPLYPAGWGGGGMTFSHADERWRSYEQDGVKKYRPTWDVQAWTPLTVTPSLLIHGHETGHGRTPDVHGFVTGGRWVPA